jgi:hypothetical protein
LAQGFSLTPLLQPGEQQGCCGANRFNGFVPTRETAEAISVHTWSDHLAKSEVLMIWRVPHVLSSSEAAGFK